MHDFQKELLTKRIPHDEIILGRAYIIHARNGGVGIASKNGDQIEYTLNRIKWGANFLDNEIDWEDHEFHGTAIPLRLLPDSPPENREEWLDWLAVLEEVHEEEIASTWGIYGQISLKANGG